MGKVYFPDMSIFSFLAYLQLIVTELEHKVRKKKNNKRYKGRKKISSDLSWVERDYGTFLGENPKRSTAWVWRETWANDADLVKTMLTMEEMTATH